MNRTANQTWAYESPRALRYRERRDVLLAAELVRRPACEPVLRALALDRLPLRARAHLAVCASCRRADGELRGASRRGGLLIVLVVLAGIVAIPFATSRTHDEPSLLPPHAARGGAALVAQHAPVPVPAAPEAGQP